MKNEALKILPFWAVVIAAAVFLTACQTETTDLKDGYYTAQAASFNRYGWKEFITIYVNNNTIVTAEYNAKNASGFIRSWDMDNMRQRRRAVGTYPNKYARAYTVALLNRQDPAQVQAVAGAEAAHRNFQALAAAAIARARDGNKMVAFVSLSDAE